MIRVLLPAHLRTLARVEGEVYVESGECTSIAQVLDALETRYPMLLGTIRPHGTPQRRPLIRFFACERDLSHEPMDRPLPREVLDGQEPLLIVGALAGG